MLPLNSSDLVHRSVDGVYHAACFTCIFCGQLLQPGDEYVLHETQLVCRMDYEALMQTAYGPGIVTVIQICSNGKCIFNDQLYVFKEPSCIQVSNYRRVIRIIGSHRKDLERF